MTAGYFVGKFLAKEMNLKEDGTIIIGGLGMTAGYVVASKMIDSEPAPETKNKEEYNEPESTKYRDMVEQNKDKKKGVYLS